MSKSKLTNCKVCGAEIAHNAKVCPSCGAKIKKPVYKRWWFILLMVFVVIGIIGNILPAMDESSPDTQVQNEASDEKKSEEKSNEINGFEIIGDIEATSDGYNAYIEGTLKNNTGKDLSYAEIDFTIYDSNGNVVESALDNINNLGAGKTWKFKAYVIADDFAKWELTDISGF